MPSSSTSNSVVSRLSQVKDQIMGSVDILHAETVFNKDVCPAAPTDPMFGLMAAYREDKDPKKVDLGIGAYRDDKGQPWRLPVVKEAEKVFFNDPNVNHEYLPIEGLADFTNAAQQVILGKDSPAIAESRACTLQTISGTGAVHLGALFLVKFLPKPTPAIYLSSPTWANHNQIFTNVGLSIKNYPYFSAKTKMLDFEGMMSSIKSAPKGSIILLHACAHNPTGVDLTKDQWKEVASVMKEKELLPFFDCAYQGFASGDLAQDNYSIRHFVDQGFELVIAQSFAKNFGLYGQRAGAFHFVANPSSGAKDVVSRVKSQLQFLQRSEISNPPIFGAKIASIVLNDPKLFKQWEEDLKTMSGRIIEMRKSLKSELDRLETPGTWDHITSQIGMFSFTGLTEAQVQELRSKWHVYMTKNGRISMAGLNTGNYKYFAEAVDDVVRRVQ